jgi:D-alanyl-lipoteichoic acid acyltransferase DltB (MBOAT superfamily)
MTVPSFSFLAFAIAAAILYNLPLGTLPFGPVWRKIVLLAANVLFLASFAHSPSQLLPFLGFLALGYLMILVLLRTGSVAGVSILGIAAILLAFVWLKKYSFVPSALFIETPYVTIGLSYVFFRVLHLVIDTGQGGISARPRLLDYANYTLNFLCLVSGPIQRFEDYLQQETAGSQARLTAAILVRCAERVVLGMFKVLVISMLLIEQHKLAVIALGYDQDTLSRAGLLLQAILIYPIYLYANFSGYCDVVIALGLLFHLRIPENFDRPFLSENFITFWSRWHMTLSTWLKTYVYSPMMMKLLQHIESQRADALVSAFAFFVTFFLVGAWHGQSTEFLFFGLLQGGGVAVNKLYQTFMIGRLGRKGYRALCTKRLYVMVSRGLTFIWFAFTLLWFWSDWATIGLILHTLPAMMLVGVALFAILACSLLLEALAASFRIVDRSGGSWKHTRAALASIQIVLIWGLAVVLAAPAPEIVYKAF